ncbi:MAG: CotH kinase family protein, partial [Cytophagaceae bacterium]
MTRFLFIVAFLSVHLGAQAQQVVINEIMASNHSVIADEDGDYEDWIELFNAGNYPINLHGYTISDNLNNPYKWSFPSVSIAPNSYLLIFASGKNRKNGTLHTNFKISASGEPIALYDPFGGQVDLIEETPIPTNHSFGRETDGASEMIFFSVSTPGYSNTQGQEQIPLKELTFSHTSGFYQSPFQLTIDADKEDVKIYYTIDGTSPDTSSLVYSTPIDIIDRSNLENVISEIRTNPESIHESITWKAPKGKVFKANIIRVKAFLNGEPYSEEYTYSFFVHPNMNSKYSLPIISITTDPKNLFDYDSGIYVPGLHHDIDTILRWHWGTGNFHQRGPEWEKPAYMEYFEKDGSISVSQHIGIRIHGFGSRGLPQKSLRLYARNIFGTNTFNYQFFKDRDFSDYNRILLRNSGQDFSYSMFKDALTGLMVDPMKLEYQKYQPSIVFINGEYWGIHNVRDRIDERFLEYATGADPEKVDLLNNNSEVMAGSNEDYLKLMEFIEDSDLEDDGNFMYVASEIDVDNYIDYQIAKQFISVYDWPGNNIRFWRTTEPKSKWRWIFFDNDDALKRTDFNAIEHSLNEDGPIWPNPAWSTFLFRNLIKNEKFKEQYLQRLNHHLDNTFAHN